MTPRGLLGLQAIFIVIVPPLIFNCVFLFLGAFLVFSSFALTKILLPIITDK